MSKPQSSVPLKMLPYVAKGDEIQDMEGGDYCGLSGWAQCNHKGP